MLFDHIYDSWKPVQYEKYLQIEAYIPSRGFVLDVGTGNGYFQDFVRITKPELKIIGIDISSEMLKQNKNPDIIRAHGDFLPFRPVFDIITCFDVLHVIKGTDLKIVMKDNGLILVLQFVRFSEIETVKQIRDKLAGFKIEHVEILEGQEKSVFMIGRMI
ncbi:MAG: class I SAM-dependent methyltransferase [Candidatus Aenigmarchaeota archaeon]|nr:class I SAM-dependent methyltransferase [Candidatus Aenigmarchaeota archaeon]